jgi:hypothetical protein
MRVTITWKVLTVSITTFTAGHAAAGENWSEAFQPCGRNWICGARSTRNKLHKADSIHWASMGSGQMTAMK